MSDEELRAFVADQWIVQVATTGPRGRPHLVPLWYVPDGTDLRGWTYAASQKARNLERDPRATLSIDDGVAYEDLRGVMMECDVELERDTQRVAEYGTALFERYTSKRGRKGAPPLAAGGELAPEVREMVEKQAQKRVGLRFLATRTVTWDHRKLGGTY
jgi:PPOX class probable F420-dependent enzyme